VGDVTSEADRARALDSIGGTEAGFPDILVNNAGIERQAPFVSTTFEDYDRHKQVLLDAVFFLTQSVVNAWMESKTSGTVLNIASVAGDVHFPGLAAYSTAKAGIRGMTGALALELAPFSIRVNAVAPGHIDTEMSSVKNDPGATARRVASIPAGRLGTPEDVAGVAAFLVSERASYITGQTLTVDGGYTLL
jgi:glucose 1-dehydrogenase